MRGCVSAWLSLVSKVSASYYMELLRGHPLPRLLALDQRSTAGRQGAAEDGGLVSSVAFSFACKM